MIKSEYSKHNRSQISDVHNVRIVLPTITPTLFYCHIQVNDFTTISSLIYQNQEKIYKNDN